MNNLKNHISFLITSLFLTLHLCSQVPVDFDDFVSVDSYASVEDAIQNETYIYFPGRTDGQDKDRKYFIDNPIIIDDGNPRYLYGVGFKKVTLVPNDKSQPLFIINDATGFRMCNFFINSKLDADSINYEAIRFNSPGIKAEFQNMRIFESSVSIKASGDYIFDLVGWVMNGKLDNGLIVDDSLASVYLVSCSGENDNSIPDAGPDISWVWMKNGHLEAYSCFPAGYTRGSAGDFRIECPSHKGFHIIAFNRSEGTKRKQGGLTDADQSKLLYVPPSDKEINIALKANRLGCQEPNTSMVDYNAAGTVWLIANRCDIGNGITELSSIPLDSAKTYLISGNAPDANIVAIGNVVANTAILSHIHAANKVSIANIGDLQALYNTADDAFPPGVDDMVFFENGRLIDASIPVFYDTANIPIIDVPMVNYPLNSELDLVNVKDYGAQGDGVTDDTDEIQAALDDKGWKLYFPPGTYIITSELTISGFRSAFGGCGGWIAGAGSDVTTIKNTSGGSVVKASGVCLYLIQGITFETTDQSDICFALDHGADYSTSNLFYDCRFKGGNICMGTAVISGPNCEHMSMQKCVFDGGVQGWVHGNPNALMNVVHECEFKNCDYNFGVERWDDTTSNNFGNFGILSATCTGTGIADFARIPRQKSGYVHKLVSDATQIYSDKNETVFTYSQVFGSCTWNNLTTDTIYSNVKSGGPIFIHSDVTGDKIIKSIPPDEGRGFIINLWSNLAGWNSSRNWYQSTGKTHVKYFRED